MVENILDAIFEQDMTRVAQQAQALPVADQRILRLFDGIRSLAAVVAASPAAPAETLEAAVRLAKRGLVLPRSPGRAVVKEEPAFSALEEEFFARPPRVDEAEYEPQRRAGVGGR